MIIKTPYLSKKVLSDCYLRCSRWAIPEILGFKGYKMYPKGSNIGSQRGQNHNFWHSKVKYSTGSPNNPCIPRTSLFLNSIGHFRSSKEPISKILGLEG